MQITEQEQKILNVISDYHDKTDGKCGISAVDIAEKLNTSFLNIRDSLNNLNDKNAFKIRNGINHLLIFKK